MSDRPLLPGQALPRDEGPGLAALLDLIDRSGTVSVWQLGELADLLRRWLPGGKACAVGGPQDASYQLLAATALRMTLMQLHRISTADLSPLEGEGGVSARGAARLATLKRVLGEIADEAHHRALLAAAADPECEQESPRRRKLLLQLARLLNRDEDLHDSRMNVALPHTFPSAGETIPPWLRNEEVWWAMVANAVLDVYSRQRSELVTLHQMLGIPAWLATLPSASRVNSPWPIRNLAAAVQNLLPFKASWEHGYRLSSGVLYQWFAKGSRDSRRVERMRQAVVAFDVDHTLEGGHAWQQFQIQLDADLYAKVMDEEAADLAADTGVHPWRKRGSMEHNDWLRSSAPLVLAAGLRWNNSSSGATYSDDDTVFVGAEIPSTDNPRWLFTWNQTLTEPDEEINQEDMPDAPDPRDRYW